MGTYGLGEDVSRASSGPSPTSYSSVAIAMRDLGSLKLLSPYTHTGII
jgi:hypothetical protein